MSQPISSLKNLGPISESMLNQVGIISAEELSKQDPVDVYLLLKLFGFRVNHIMLWALYGAINNRDLNDISEKTKVALQTQLQVVEDAK